MLSLDPQVPVITSPSDSTRVLDLEVQAKRRSDSTWLMLAGLRAVWFPAVAAAGPPAKPLKAGSLIQQARGGTHLKCWTERHELEAPPSTQLEAGTGKNRTRSFEQCKPPRQKMIPIARPSGANPQPHNNRSHFELI